MLITNEEYYAMGFTAPSDEEAERCIKRAGYIISSLTDGRADVALAEGGEAAELIKQAVGFEAEQLVYEESAAPDTEESVTLGDFSYKQKSSAVSAVRSADEYKENIIGLLRAAGVMFKGVKLRGY